ETCECRAGILQRRLPSVFPHVRIAAHASESCRPESWVIRCCTRYISDVCSPSGSSCSRQQVLLPLKPGPSSRRTAWALHPISRPARRQPPLPAPPDGEPPHLPVRLDRR